MSDPTASAQEQAPRAILATFSGGGICVDLEDSLNVVIRQGDRQMTVTHIEGLREALALARDERHVRETVAADSAGAPWVVADGA